MKKLYFYLLFLLSVLSGRSQDVANSYNIPGFPRFKDSKIIWQRKFNFDKYYILKKENNEIKPIKIEGELLRTQYDITGEHSVYEIAKGYKNIFKSNNFDIIISLDETNFSDNISEKLYNGEFGGLNALPHNANKPDYKEHFSYIVAKKDNVYFVILLTQFNEIMMTVDRIEEKNMNNAFSFPSNDIKKDSKNNTPTKLETKSPTIESNPPDDPENYSSINNFDKLEIDVFINFWDPLGSEIKSTNDVYVYKINQDYYYAFNFGGFGQSINPAVNISYFLSRKFGLALGGNFLILKNERDYNTGDSSVYFYNNGSIDNLTFGFVFRTINNDNNINFYYSFGFNYVTNYDLTIKFNNDPDITARGSAMGIYSTIGISVKLYKTMYLKSKMYYTFIPTGLEFHSNNVIIHEETTIGGLGTMIGIGLKF